MGSRNRRRFRRYEVDRIRGRLQFSSRLEVRNLSLTGVAVEANFPMRIGKQVLLPMRGAADGVDVSAEVKWCSLVDVRTDARGRVTNLYHAGLDFSQAIDENAQEILSFIEGHIVVEPDRELVGRFRRHGAPVHIAGPGSFRLCKVGFSGMQIEAELRRCPSLDSIMDIALRTPELPIECAVRVTNIEKREPVSSGSRYRIALEYQNLSIDDCLQLNHFIRGRLE